MASVNTARLFAGSLLRLFVMWTAVAKPPAGRRHDYQGHRAEADHARPVRCLAVRVQGGEHSEPHHRREVVDAHVGQHDYGEALPGPVEDPGDDDAEYEAEGHEQEDGLWIRPAHPPSPLGHEQRQVAPGPPP